MALEDGMMFLSFAAQALSHDEFSRCFEPKPTIQPSDHLLYWLYLLGMGIRYGVLFPVRLLAFLLATILFLLTLPALFLLRDGRLIAIVFRTYCKAWLFAFSAIIRHHGRKPSPQEPHLFVANHTSFIDYFLLSSRGAPHATVAQVHGGIFGWFQRHALALNGSLFFNRSEHKDRLAVARKMQRHIDGGTPYSPLIIFPEGTCVNNESTVLFHKGAFELDGLICPVAIKYNKRLLDPYWNSREQTFTQHALYLMTRWLMIADVWWLPPQRRAPGETAIQFAERVKALISETAGLKNLSWDGYMKNCMQSKDQEKMRRSSQAHYVTVLRRRLTPGPGRNSSDHVPTPGGEKKGAEEGGEEEEPTDELNGSGPLNGFESDINKTRPKQVNGSSHPHIRVPNASSGLRRRAASLISSEDYPLSANQTVAFSAPTTRLYLPSWLSEGSVVNIKNELIISGESKTAAAQTHNADGSSPTVAASLDLLRHIRERKDGVVQAWRFYSRASRLSPVHYSQQQQQHHHHHQQQESICSSPTTFEGTERRLENGSWRLWFKQRQEEGRSHSSLGSPRPRMSAISLPDMENVPAAFSPATLASSVSDTHLNSPRSTAHSPAA